MTLKPTARETTIQDNAQTNGGILYYKISVKIKQNFFNKYDLSDVDIHHSNPSCTLTADNYTKINFTEEIALCKIDSNRYFVNKQ